ncbi:MAG TPA: 50S ribosomal protein L3 [Actinobacteria bacterium]|jgi:large subunit ribosomal protein L3|nr:50S ribosomal protein L3 [Actinomycetota bacterium]
MVSAIYGKKIGSTQIFDDAGNAVNVTAIYADPCKIVQIKNVESDGYNALKIGFSQAKENKVSKPLKGEFNKAKVETMKYLKEIRLDDFNNEYKVGDTIDLSVFNIGDLVKITGTSKGKGFAGVIKRYNFRRGPMTHGSHNIRRPGSVGMSATPKKILKGKKMPGRMGGVQVTTPPTRIISILNDDNMILVKGSVPGAKGSLVFIRKA